MFKETLIRKRRFYIKNNVKLLFVKLIIDVCILTFDFKMEESYEYYYELKL